MSFEASLTPTDPASLRTLIETQDAEIDRLQSEVQRQAVHLKLLQEQINLLTAKRYGRSSEQCPPAQGRLFNEAEVAVDDVRATEPNTIEVAAHRRARGGRKPLPTHLPRVEVIHDLPDTEKVCAEDGVALVVIGEDCSEQLDIIPAQVRVIRHVRKKYACPHCGQGVKTAPIPPQPIPKSLASAGLAAHIAVGKYQDALPLYRQEQIFARMGVEISRATLASWMIQVGRLVQPLLNLLRDRLLAYDIVQMDETTVQVLKEPGKSAHSRSYLWVQRGGPPGQPIILFDYDPSRSQAVPLRLLEGYQGYLQVDGYEGYAAIGAQPGITLVGCLAHARRKFDEALKAQGRAAHDPTIGGKAKYALQQIQTLYRIERDLKAAPPDERYRVRQAQAKPVLDALSVWVQDALPTVPPESLIGKALHYLHRQWPKLIRYLEDGRLAIDNNGTENTIRPFVIGRNNWLFCDTQHGAKASANLYSLILTAKANSHEPYYYLRHVFTEIPKAISLADLEALLPFNTKPEEISRALL